MSKEKKIKGKNSKNYFIDCWGYNYAMVTESEEVFIMDSQTNEEVEELEVWA